MTLEEKVGQMTQTERGAVFDNPSLIAEDQVPVNVGDRDYEPLFPYGWG